MHLLPLQITLPILSNKTKPTPVIKARKGERTIGLWVLGISVGGAMVGEMRKDEEVGENSLAISSKNNAPLEGVPLSEEVASVSC